MNKEEAVLDVTEKLRAVEGETKAILTSMTVLNEALEAAIIIVEPAHSQKKRARKCLKTALQAVWLLDGCLGNLHDELEASARSQSIPIMALGGGGSKGDDDDDLNPDDP